MTLSSIISMLLIIGFIVGGFIYFLSVAFREEKDE
ncbi:MetS family NSS transporter small subunit [Flammeovirgaceae bacterium SG7u.111]|nr:MetS family NSS transporter small subunit [Flammeovirgaceae bacterium SG7u.132]WPO34399.1 MetS family NSS transporter small subunit [Flammeovirgaceae bacterium SG7u.111]